MAKTFGNVILQKQQIVNQFEKKDKLLFSLYFPKSTLKLIYF